MENKIYVLSDGTYEDRHTVAVFDNTDDLQDFINKHVFIKSYETKYNEGGECDVEVFYLNPKKIDDTQPDDYQPKFRKKPLN